MQLQQPVELEESSIRAVSHPPNPAGSSARQVQQPPDSREPGGCSTWLEAEPAVTGACGVPRSPDSPGSGPGKPHHGPDPAGSEGRCMMNLAEQGCPISRDPFPKRQDAPIPNPLVAALTVASNSGCLSAIGALRPNRPDRFRSQDPIKRGNWKRNRLSDRAAVRRFDKRSVQKHESHRYPIHRRIDRIYDGRQSTEVPLLLGPYTKDPRTD
jgi:hypothetical protein